MTLQDYIVYEDASLLVVDKPSGLVANRSNTVRGETLQDLLVEYLQLPSPEEISLDASSSPKEVFIARSGLAHRLDKDTSGLVLVGKTPEALQKLMTQFKDRKVSKHYVALVYGKLKDPVVEINAPLGRNPRNPLRFAVVTSGKPARTLLKVITSSDDYTLVDVMPKTGRTHQIRVHLSALNHSVVGDILYAPKNLLSMSKDNFSRLMLHAYTISVVHPESEKLLTFEAKLPSEFDISSL